MTEDPVTDESSSIEVSTLETSYAAEQSPANLGNYQVIRPSLFERRSVRLAITLTIFLILATLTCLIKLTPDRRAEVPDTVAFQTVKIAPAQAPPPPPPPPSADMPNPTTAELAPAATPTIVSPSFQHTFEMPKAELPMPTISIADSPGTSTDLANDPNGDGGNGNGKNNDSSTKTTDDGTIVHVFGNTPPNQVRTGGSTTITTQHDGVTSIATTNLADLAAALNADTRDGQIIGSFVPSPETRPYAQEIHDIINNPILKMGWLTSKDGETTVVIHGDGNTASDNTKPTDPGHDPYQTTLDGTNWNIACLPNNIERQHPKTWVILASFHRTQNPYETKRLIDTLRRYNVRLCIITLINAPYSELIDYVKESGGIIVCTHGIPPEITAELLAQKTSGNSK